jgi:NTP pyrophosphatase (non-canonical NTP hydrolase)
MQLSEVNDDEYTEVTLDQYQKAAVSSLSKDVVDQKAHLAFGLASEAGEVATVFQKYNRKDPGYYAGVSLLTPEAASKLALELGDVLWHVAALANEKGWPLSIIAAGNLEKLTKRVKNGTIKGDGDYRQDNTEASPSTRGSGMYGLSPVE